MLAQDGEASVVRVATIQLASARDVVAELAGISVVPQAVVLAFAVAALGVEVVVASVGPVDHHLAVESEQAQQWLQEIGFAGHLDLERCRPRRSRRKNRLGAPVQELLGLEEHHFVGSGALQMQQTKLQRNWGAERVEHGQCGKAASNVLELELLNVPPRSSRERDGLGPHDLTPHQ